MQLFRVFLVVFTLSAVFVDSGASGAEVKQSASEKNGKSVVRLKKEVADLKNKIGGLEQQILNDRNEQGKLNEELRTQIKTLQSSEERIGNDQVSLKNKVQSLSLPTVGTWLLIIGMILEIIGGTALTGNALAAEIKEVRSLRITHNLVDLGTDVVNRSDLMNFLAAIGTTCLVIGFLLQFIAVVVVITLPTSLRVTLIGCALVLPGAVLFYLSGQNPEQTRVEKLKMILRNFDRTIICPLADSVAIVFNRTVLRCDVCLRKVELHESELQWSLDGSLPGSSVHGPVDLRIGHPACLNEYFEARNHQGSTMLTTSIQKCSPGDFHKVEASKMLQWFETRRQQILAKGGKKKGESEREARIKWLLEKIAKVTS